MNTLLASSTTDITADDIVEYIIFHGGNLERIHADINLVDITIFLSNKEATFELEDLTHRKFRSTDFDKYWARRAGLSYYVNENELTYLKELGLIEFLTNEFNLIRNYIFETSFEGGLPQKDNLNNRILNSSVAKKVGLNIPTTLVTTSKSAALNFVEMHPTVVTKPIGDNHFSYSDGNSSWTSSGTRLVTIEDLENLSDTFFPMHLQEYISKDYEVRVFVYKDLIYAMAIFSQMDPQTKIDYRNYNNIRPNRNVPYSLPQVIQSKIIHLMSQLGLTTCSMDLIVTPENEFYFLEVNPSGQIKWMSVPCNFYIEEALALKILGIDEKNK